MTQLSRTIDYYKKDHSLICLPVNRNGFPRFLHSESNKNKNNNNNNNNNNNDNDNDNDNDNNNAIAAFLPSTLSFSRLTPVEQISNHKVQIPGSLNGLKKQKS